MTAESQRIAPKADQISPDDLLSGFAKSHLVRWFSAALLLHVIVIGGFSIGTIRDWVDPEGAKARKEAAIAAAKATPAEAADPAEAAHPAETADPAEGTPTDSKAATAKRGEANPDGGTTAAAAKTPIEKVTTEAAKPTEIPSAPDDLGLTIEDTNPN